MHCRGDYCDSDRQYHRRLFIHRLFERLDKTVVPELRGSKISVSAGVALHAGENASSFDALYAKADSAMYSSKKTAGNSMTFSG
ncbi:MAG: diguanylate cyclase [Clostridia bacterium]|nr:diguanylate cyclase [Clostridia bacterium]MBR0217683.1 diguanylate cyclase [Clostridia bacterium]